MRNFNMPTLAISIFLLLPINFFTQIEVAFAAAFPPSVAYFQTDFWSKNVINPMPETIKSKLSPLSSPDYAINSTITSTNQESFNMNGFCSKANLACTPLSKTSLRMIKATINGYLGSPTSNTNSHDDESVDPNFFFRLSSVFQEGKQIQLPSFDKASLPPRSFLPSHYASKISITSSSDLQKIFPDLFASNPMKETIERSISFCTSPSRAGEIKTCSNSLEDMIQFSKQTLGRSSGKLLALTSKSEKGSGKELEIGKIKRLHTQKMVSCHEVFYPFATYFCHFLPSSTTRLYAVDFVDPGTKAQVNTILALCHMDTSAWPAENMALKVLKLSPGKGEACHWYGKDDLVWI